MKVKDIDIKHPEYEACCDAWSAIELLVRGGHEIRKQASRFLIKRPKELPEVYQQRLSRFTYQNILGTALGWYKASLFGTDPIITGADEDFLADCNRAGKTFTDFFRDVVVDLLQFRTAYVLTDLPKSDVQPSSYAEQKASGALNPYLVRYTPREVINWDFDSYGNLLWIVIAVEYGIRGFGQKALTVDRWYYFDRTTFQIFEAERKEDKKDNDADVRLVDEGKHALTAENRVPVRRIEIPVDMWMADRALPQAIDHLNQDNTLAWALFMSNLPIPVVKGELEGEMKATEAGYIQLSENGEFSFAEPSGRSFEYSGKRIDSLREEVYRQFCLQAQGRSATATASAQSGYSKEMDMIPAADMLNAFGDVMRAAMTNVLVDVEAAAHRGNTEITITGFDFDQTDPGEIEADQTTLDIVGNASPTFRKEVFKRAALRRLNDADDFLKTKIKTEIDSSPDDPEAELLAKRQAMIRGSLTKPLADEQSLPVAT